MNVMSRNISFLAATALLAAAPAFAQTTEPEQDVRPPSERSIDPPPAEEILREPERPLSDRVQDPSKITETNPPPMPERIVLPMPPDHSIANSAENLPIDQARYEKAREAIERGLAFLRENQDDNGAWLSNVREAPTDQPGKPSPVSVAVTAMALKGFAQAGEGPETSATARKALEYIASAQLPDGSYVGGALANYVTAATVSALAAIDDRTLQDQLAEATEWLQATQWDQTEGISPRQDWFGGAGYGNRGRPDLSNTQMMLDALYDAGLDPNEPAFQKALTFLQRTQNLEQTNPAEWAGNDGGFVYTPANNGESLASEAAGEGRWGENFPAGEPRSLRSYGSMTYAGFKSMLYAGLSPDDVRVRAAFDWIRKHFTFDENPGLGSQGLYYYYHTMSRALRVAQQDIITDESGEKHNWRAELIDAIVERQNPDGSWVNAAERWMEGIPEMATIYSVLALEEALKEH